MSDSPDSRGAAELPPGEGDGTLIRPRQPATASPSVQFVPATAPAPAAEMAATLLGQSGVETPNAPEESSPRSATRFRPLRPHARGGLGQVLVAVDEELGREVALKEIQAPFADDADSRARFLLEAEVTGQLEHPGIVPVYGLGAYADGRPYYAMRFIRGGSLQDAIRHFHDADVAARGRRDPGERALELSKLLRRFVDVCNAIAYAHSKGVIHRDIKPANVMLGEYGETLVVDWGLAKKLGRASLGRGGRAAAPEGVDPLRSVEATTPFAPAVTVEGSAIGTPAFMSPEQAAGSLDLMGVASDVYSLGATLYTLLTGCQPFTGPDLMPTLERVKLGMFSPPREIKKSVPPALEAVCLKAMSRRPEDRYGKALELAEEIERWLADEPVKAYRDPFLVRAGRWARRHRTAVTASAVLLLTAVIALAVTAALVSKEKARTEQQRQLAEDNFQTALRAVDDMLTEAAQEELASEPRMEKKRKKLLERARTYYRQFLEQHGNDQRLRRETALAYKRLGDVSKLLGEYAPAREEYAQATALLDLLVADLPGDVDLRSVLAEIHCNVGETWRLEGHPDRAEPAYDRAVKLQRQLIAEAPDRPAFRKELARTQYNRGLLFGNTNRFGQAEEALRESVALLTRLAQEHPEVAAYRQHLARAHLNRGPVLQQNGRPEETEESFAEAVFLLNELIERDKLTPDYRHELGTTYTNLGHLYFAVKRLARAEEAHRQAIALFDRLTVEFPSVPTYRQELALAQSNLAITVALLKQWDAAEQTLRQSLKNFEELSREHADVVDYQARQSLALTNLGWLYLQRQKVSGDSPGRRERLTTARHYLEQARPLIRAALKHNPNSPLYLETLRGQSEYLAEVHLLLGAHAEAAKFAQEVPAAFRTRGADYRLAAELLLRCAAVAGQGGRGPYADQALELLRQGVAHGFSNPEQLREPAFAALRGRDDFEKLVASLKKKP